MAVIAASSARRGDRYELRLILASSLGNALEWFDFVIFGFLAATIAELFFPATDRNTSILLTFATFGITFLLRPLGAVLLGSYADRHGRRRALVLAIGLMTLGSAIIGLAPTYQAIGVAAPLLVLLARSLQGLSAGGELGTVMAFMTEHDLERRGYFASWPLASQGLATVLATGCGMALAGWLTPEQRADWGWRAPFLLGVAVGPVALYIRTRLAETPVFRSIEPAKTPARDLAASGKAGLALCAGLTAAPAVMMYLLLYLPTYADAQLGLSARDAYVGGALAGLIQLVLIPAVGWLSDRLDRTALALAAAVLMLAIAYPLFVWISMEASRSALIQVQAVIGVVSAVYLGALGGVLTQQFPAQTRSSGVALGHAIGVTLFGGLAPFIFALLVTATGNRLSPAFFVGLAAFISLLALVVIRRRDRWDAKA